MKHSSILLHFPSLSSLTIPSSSNKTNTKDLAVLDSSFGSSLPPSNNISAIRRTSTDSSASITTASTASTISTSSSHASITDISSNYNNNNQSHKAKRRSFIHQVKSFFQHNHSKSIQSGLENTSNRSSFNDSGNKRRNIGEKRRSVPPTFMSKKASTCFHPQHCDDKIYLQQPSNNNKAYRRHKRCLSDYGQLIRNKHSSIKDCPIGTGASATVVLTQRKDKYSNTTSFYAVKVFQPIIKHGNSNNKKATTMRRIHKKNNNKMTIRTEAHFMKKLISEFCISSSLHHPNIVRTLDLVVDEKNRFCTVMEYCSGGDLYNFIKDGRLTCIDEVNGYFKQLLNGLAYLHRIGVAHRDIKPENLLLAGRGVLKITDFGEADVFREAHHHQPQNYASPNRQQKHSTMTTYLSDTAINNTTVERLSDGLCGSTPYIAPEIFICAKQGYRASQADVWSAGIVYFCMRFHGVPFYSATQTDSNYRIYQKCFGNYQQHRLTSGLVNSDKDSGNVRDDEEDLIIRQQTDDSNRRGNQSLLSLTTTCVSSSIFDNESSVVVDYPAFRDLEPDAKDMLYAMLNPDPEQRYTIQDVLNLPWLADIKPSTEEEEKRAYGLSSPYSTTMTTTTTTTNSVDQGNQDTLPASPINSSPFTQCAQCIDNNNTSRNTARTNFRRSVA